MIPYIIATLAATAASLLGIFSNRFKIPEAVMSLLVVVCFWIGLAGSQWSITNLPVLANFETFFPKQVWQRILWPVGGLLVFSVAIESFGNRLRSDSKLLLYAIAFLVTLYSMLPFAPLWEDLVPENAFWLMVSTASALGNYQAIQLMMGGDKSDSGQRWVLWGLVATFGAIAGVMFSQIGSLGEWCVAIMLITTIFAVAVSISGELRWLTPIIPSLCLLAAILIANIRFNATQIKPWWIFVILGSLPIVLAVIDCALQKRLPKYGRVLTSAAIAAVLCGLVMGHVWLVTPATE